jgi:hypothetical protein
MTAAQQLSGSTAAKEKDLIAFLHLLARSFLHLLGIYM